MWTFVDAKYICLHRKSNHVPLFSQPVIWCACACARARACVRQCTSAYAHAHTNSQRLHNMTLLKPRFGVERINHAPCYMQVRTVVIKNTRICEHLFSVPTNLHWLVGSLHKCKYYLYAWIWNMYCDVHSQIGSFKRHNCGTYFLHWPTKRQINSNVKGQCHSVDVFCIEFNMTRQRAGSVVVHFKFNDHSFETCNFYTRAVTWNFATLN